MMLNSRAMLSAGALLLSGLSAALLPGSAIASATLKIVQGSGDFQTLESAITLTAPKSLTLEWTTDQATAAGGHWEVTDITTGQTMASGTGRIVIAPQTVVASGDAAPAPKPGYRAWITLPATAFLKSPSTATTLKFNIRITPHDAAKQPMGSSSPVVHVTQTATATTPPINFGNSGKYPIVEIASYEEKIGVVPYTQIHYAGADVTVRLTNKNTKTSDPVWLSLKDANVLMRQNTSKVYVPGLAPGASQLVSVHLDAVLPPAQSQLPQDQQYSAWGQQLRDACGVDLRSVLDFGGAMNQAPMDDHREAFLVKEGWSDYAKVPMNTPICDGKQCVRVCQIEKNIRARLDGNVVGYSFLAGQYPHFGSGGHARTTANGTAQDFKPDTKITVASVSKFVTAVAAVAILDKYKVSLDAPIGPYLPSDWSSATNYVKNLSFAQLLGQRSGIMDYGNVPQDYAQLKKFFTASIGNNVRTTCQASDVMNPSNPINPGNMTWCYSNYNFAIMRILLPRVAGYAEDANQGSRPQTLANQYTSLVQQNVFDKVGRNGVACKPPALNNHAYAYKGPGSNTAGKDWGDVSLICGAAGWYLSAEDMGTVLMSINAKDGKILATNPDRLADLRTRGLGLDVALDGEIEKNGSWGANCDANSKNCDLITTSVAIFGPVSNPRVLGVLFLNSNITGGPNVGANAKKVLEDAYNAAIYTLP